MSKRKRSDPVKPAAQFKSFAFDTKAVAEEPDEDGMVYVPAYGSVFDVLDSHEDMTVKGAFTDTLAAWAEKNAPIPAHFNHAMFSSDPLDNVGFLKEATEDDHGLKLLIGLDVEHNTKAAYLHRLIKQKRLRELSIGYIAKSWEFVKKDGAQHDWDTYRKLTAVDLLEVSFVSVASNREATVLAKAASLIYGGDEAKADDDAATEDEAESAEALGTAIAALEKVVESLSAVAESLAGDETNSEDEDDSDDDDSGQKAGAKSLSVRVRAALAISAASAVETE